MGHTLGAGWQVLWVKCGASRDILGHRVTVTLGVGWWVTPRFLCFSESADAHRLTRANSTTRHRMMCECYICPNKKCLGIQNQNDKEYWQVSPIKDCTWSLRWTTGTRWQTGKVGRIGNSGNCCGDSIISLHCQCPLSIAITHRN